jgi:hypothetical protein
MSHFFFKKVLIPRSPIHTAEQMNCRYKGATGGKAKRAMLRTRETSGSHLKRGQTTLTSLGLCKKITRFNYKTDHGRFLLLTKYGLIFS